MKKRQSRFGRQLEKAQPAVQARSARPTNHFEPLEVRTMLSASLTDSAALTHAVGAGLRQPYSTAGLFAGALSSKPATPVSFTMLVSPSNLKATLTTTGGVSLTWKDNDPSAVGYAVLRATDAGTQFLPVTTVKGGSAISYVDASTIAGHSYTYVVSALGAAGVSPPSSPVTVTVTAPNPKPSVLAPTGLTATVGSTGSVSLTWTDKDSSANAYAVLAAADGSTNFQVLNVCQGGTVNSYVDTTAISGHKYTYEVETMSPNGLSPASSPVTVTVTTPIPIPGSPINLGVGMYSDTSNGTSYVSLNWMDNDKTVTGYNVLRSINGGAYTQIGTSTYPSFLDKTVAADTACKYEVLAVNKTGTLSNPAYVSLTTAPGIPTALTATATTGKVTLNWSDTDSLATGYTIYRSADGITYTKLATVTGASTKTYVDTTLTAGATGLYEVTATGPGGSSSISNYAQAQMPLVANSLSIFTRFGTELVLSDSKPNDTISITQSGTMLSITENGTTKTTTATSGGLFVYLRGGNDTLSINSTVQTKATVMAINAMTDTLNIAPATDNAWIDANDTFSGKAIVHSVSSFAGNVSKSIGASLPTPTDVTSTAPLNLSLFGSGVTAADCNQGQAGDCWLISTIASLANTSPSVITNSMVDMGDGTYVVQLYDNGQAQYFRVNNLFPTAGFQLNMPYYARYGSADTAWAMVLEKAYADYRTGANTYQSLNGGDSSEVFSAFNLQSTSFACSNDTDAQLFTYLSNALSAGKAVAFGTFANTPVLVKDHGYSLLSVATVNGVHQYTVRNPWGARGSTLESSTGVATLTYAQLIANFAGLTAVA